jgi:histidyl-tRNA synthetase
VAAEQLRDAGLDVIFHAGEASLKSQMKRADASGAEFAVIIGETELASDAASVKNLRVPLGGTEAEQRIVPLHLLADTLVLELSASEQDH